MVLKHEGPVIIGAGASGLIAALVLARHGMNPLVLEEKPVAGMSILRAGNGRCNILNSKLDPERFTHPQAVARVMEHFLSAEVQSLLFAGHENCMPQTCTHEHDLGTATAERLQRFFTDLGIFLTTTQDGWCYPSTMHAASVQQTLLAQAASAGAKVLTLAEVTRISRPDDHKTAADNLRFVLKARPRPARRRNQQQDDDLCQPLDQDLTIYCESLVVASGGLIPDRHTASEFWQDLTEIGALAFTPCAHVLCPIETSDHLLIQPLNGLRAQAQVELYSSREAYETGIQPLSTEQGELLLRNYGISGIAAFNLSRLAENGMALLVNFVPDFQRNALIAEIERRHHQLQAELKAHALDGLVHPTLGQALCKKLLSDDAGLIADTHAFASQAAKALQEVLLNVTGLHDADQPQVTKGGLTLTVLTP